MYSTVTLPILRWIFSSWHRLIQPSHTGRMLPTSDVLALVKSSGVLVTNCLMMNTLCSTMIVVDCGSWSWLLDLGAGVHWYWGKVHLHLWHWGWGCRSGCWLLWGYYYYYTLKPFSWVSTDIHYNINSLVSHWKNKQAASEHQPSGCNGAQKPQHWDGPPHRFHLAQKSRCNHHTGYKESPSRWHQKWFF